MTLKLNGTNSEAAPAYAGDDADTGLQCGTNELKLVTGGTARATVDSNGNLGVGTTANSDSQLHVKSGANDGNPVLRLEAATNNFLNFIQTGSVYDIRVTAGDPLSFTIGSSEKARVTSNGLTFNGDTAAANALDDYEEGTWTPTINFGGSFNGTYTVNEGFYTKIGRLVTVSCELALSSKGSTTGQVNIEGLPFTTNSDDESRASGVIGYYQDVSGIDFPIVILLEAGGTTFPLRDSASASATGVTSTNLGNGFRFYFTITYMT